MSEHSQIVSHLQRTIGGRVLSRGDEAYAAERDSLIWNGRKPARFPDILVRPESVSEVAAVVRFANEQGLQVGIRSGGHSWTASFMRNGGILLDMSAFDQFSIDRKARTAKVGPAFKGAKLIENLGEEGFFFPGGHCDTVGLGGYLLQGGFGWHSRSLGPACASIRSAQVVTAAGEIVQADAQNNEDLFWALRGAGPGFFGVVTEFELDLYDRPSVLRMTVHSYKLDHVGDIFPWAAKQLPNISPEVECVVMVKKDAGTGMPALYLEGVAISDSEEAAEEALNAIDSCPVRGQAYDSVHNKPVTFKDLYADTDTLYPADMRIAVDNAWSDADPEDVMPAIYAAVESMPDTLPGHFMMQPWGRTPNLPDMAFSFEANMFFLASSAWTDPAEDPLHQDWVTNSMKRFEPHALGIKVGDENLASRPAPFTTNENFTRLQNIRKAWDPNNVFHSYLTEKPG